MHDRHRDILVGEFLIDALKVVQIGEVEDGESLIFGALKSHLGVGFEQARFLEPDFEDIFRNVDDLSPDFSVIEENKISRPQDLRQVRAIDIQSFGGAGRSKSFLVTGDSCYILSRKLDIFLLLFETTQADLAAFNIDQ